METKQIIVVRKDLNMRKGKLAAQVAHAAMSFLIRKASWEHNESYVEMSILIDPEQENWLSGGMAKIVVYVNSESEMLDIIYKASLAKLNVKKIIDAGKTEFNGIATLTCCAIGPHSVEKFKGITDHLQLM